MGNLLGSMSGSWGDWVMYTQGCIYAQFSNTQSTTAFNLVPLVILNQYQLNLMHATASSIFLNCVGQCHWIFMHFYTRYLALTRVCVCTRPPNEWCLKYAVIYFTPVTTEGYFIMLLPSSFLSLGNEIVTQPTSTREIAWIIYPSFPHTRCSPLLLVILTH